MKAFARLFCAASVLAAAASGNLGCSGVQGWSPTHWDLGWRNSDPLEEEIPSAEDLYQQGLEILAGKEWFFFFHTVDTSKAVDTFQSIIDNYPYSDYATLAELKIADSYFEGEQYESAFSYYRDFADLHPRHEQVAYVVFRAALCHHRQARSAERDQTSTEQALLYLDQLLREHPNSSYAREAEGLWRELRTRLAQHVLEIGDFYMKDGEYQSAVDRYRQVLNEFPGLGLDADALYKLGLCYSEMDREEEAAKIFEVILQNYRESDVAKAAADLVPSAN